MYKSCPRCGRIHETGYRCRVGISYQGGAERRERSRYAWTRKSLQIREQANHLCEVCRDQGIYTSDQLEVHHIIKLKDDMNQLLEDDALVVLCQRHHKQADNGEIDPAYLRSLAARRDK